MKDKKITVAHPERITRPSLKELEERIGYSFRDKDLLDLAVTHSSLANEKGGIRGHHNERLEFLGDAALELISSEYLYKNYPDRSEGDLSRIRASMVCEPTLALCAREFGLQEFLKLGRGAELTGGRKLDSIVSDALEAVIGAIFLDGGFEEAKAFVYRRVLDDIENKRLFVDSKTNLQELIQEDGRSIEYRLDGEEGPAHDKTFSVTVLIGGEEAGSGSGHNKKTAEQHAAYAALLRLKKQK